MAEASFKPRISKNSAKMVNNRENIVERMANRKAETDKKISGLRKLQEDMMLATIKKIPTINQTSHQLQRPVGVMEQWVCIFTFYLSNFIFSLFFNVFIVSL
jgi:hypothetical protein